MTGPIPGPIPTNWNDTLLALARRVENEIDARGWDQPASLWSVRGVDTDTIDGVEHLPEDAIAVAFTVNQEHILTGHPLESLTATREDNPEVLGLVLASEGWGYSAEKTALLSTDPTMVLDSPTHYPDSVELRVVQLVLRDGSEAFALRRRGEEHSYVTTGRDGQIDGRIARVMRRMLGLPSGAHVPDLAQVRQRATAAAAWELLRGVRDSSEGNVNLDAAAEWLLGEESSPARSMLVDLSGTAGEDWDDVHRRAQDQYLALEAQIGGPEIERTLNFLRWCDPALWAAHLEENTATLEELAEELHGYVAEGALDPAAAAALAEKYLS